MQIAHQEHGQAIFTPVLVVAFTKVRVVECIKALAEDSMRVQAAACTKVLAVDFMTAQAAACIRAQVEVCILAQGEGYTMAPTGGSIRDRVVGYTMGRRITAVIDLHCRYLFKYLTTLVILMKQN